MGIVLFDNRFRENLLPFTYTKAVASIRFGIFSVQERWEMISDQPVYIHTSDYLQNRYPVIPSETHTWVDASLLLDKDLIDQILSLETEDCLADEKGLIAGVISFPSESFDNRHSISAFTNIRDYSGARRLEHPWEIMLQNDRFLRDDFFLVQKKGLPAPIPETVSAIQPEHIFIEPGARLTYCILNASTGPIYIGKDAEVMEGSSIRGPFALGTKSVVKMNSRIYGATTLGPFCMGGGEIKNSILMGYSNKGHDGYLGDSVIGEWCNFGAGATCSNIKNTAGEVKIWDIGAKSYAFIGKKCGMIMGDYSRLAINSSINTGSMIGVCCNVFGAGLLPTIIQNFSWGTEGTKYDFQKALRDIRNWKQLKNETLSEAEEKMLNYVFANHL